jgi:hypothetical protein
MVKVSAIRISGSLSLVVNEHDVYMTLLNMLFPLEDVLLLLRGHFSCRSRFVWCIRRQWFRRPVATSTLWSQEFWSVTNLDARYVLLCHTYNQFTI